MHHLPLIQRAARDSFLAIKLAMQLCKARILIPTLQHYDTDLVAMLCMHPERRLRFLVWQRLVAIERQPRQCRLPNKIQMEAAATL
jgi:hypothetical protein